MAVTTVPRTSGYAARFEKAARASVARAREAFLAGVDAEGAPGSVSPEILSSWARSRDLGVDPTRAEVPTDEPAAHRSRRLVEAAAPVMHVMADQCRDSDAWGMLLDRDCVQVSPIVGDRRHVQEGEERGGGVGAMFQEARVGTNGAGLSIERLESFLVVGEEHFRASEHGLASVGVPLRDPFGRRAGVLLLCQRISSANHLIVPYAENLARAVDERLAMAVGGDERALFDAFARHSRRPSLPVVGVSEQVFVANTAAQQLLSGTSNGDVLRDAVHEVSHAGRSRLITVTLGEDRYRVHCRVVECGDGRYGAIASLTKVVEPAVQAIAGHRATSDPLARAIDLGLPVLLVGERGTGRARRVRDRIAVAEVDGASAAADPRAWQRRLESALAEGPVLIRHLDAVPADELPRMLECIRGSSHWTAATASTHRAVFDEVFPVTVTVPPLRERTAEIGDLVRSILSDLGSGDMRCASDALAVLARHAWPGNIAQLRRVLAASAVRVIGTAITLKDLPNDIAESGRRAGDNDGLLARTERELVFDALRAANWSRDTAAAALGISRATMYRRIRQFGFQIPSSR